MVDYNFPYIFVNDGDKVIYRMSRLTWSKFAYFKMIVHDHAETDDSKKKVINIEFIDDMGDLWKFLANDIPSEKVDFSLNLKSICNTLGLLEDNNVFCGRLRSLLIEAGIQYFQKLENQIIYSLQFTLPNFIEHIKYKQELRSEVIKRFIDNNTFEDPRCFDLIDKLTLDFVSKNKEHPNQ